MCGRAVDFHLLGFHVQCLFAVCSTMFSFALACCVALVLFCMVVSCAHLFLAGDGWMLVVGGNCRWVPLWVSAWMGISVLYVIEKACFALFAYCLRLQTQ